MISEKIITEDDIIKIENKINKQINEAIKFAKSSKFPDKEELDEHIYAD